MIRRVATSAAGVLTAIGVTAAMAFGVGDAGGVLNGGGEPVGAASHSTLALDVSGPLFTETGLVPGAVVERCVAVTNAGNHSAAVALYGARAADTLTPYLRLQVTRGTRPPAAPGSCTGFTALATDFGLGAGGVQFDDTLDAFPIDPAGALRPEDDIQAGEMRAYRLRVTVGGGGDAIQGLQTVQAFAFGATSAAGGTTRTPIDPGVTRKRPPRVNPNDPATGQPDRWCARVDVPDPRGPSARRIPGTSRWVTSRRVLATYEPRGAAAKRLGLRVWTNQQGRRLVLALGERWALGVAPPRTWSSVTYRLNDERSDRSASRPYVWQIDPEHIYPGENRVRITVRVRGAQPITAEVRFRMRAWGENKDESVCTLS